MALNKEQLIELVQVVAKAEKNAPTAFSYEDSEYSYAELNEVLRSELNELAGDYFAYRKNKTTVFELMEKAVDEILPRKVFDNMKQFADVQTVKHGDKPYYRLKTGTLRGRQFVTKGAFGGRYEAFKLGEKMFPIETEVQVAAAQVGLEEMLEGKVDFADYTEVINVGFEIMTYREVMRHMIALASNVQIPTNNKLTSAGFDPIKFSALLGVVRAYGEPTIICSEMFAATIRPDGNWVTDADKNEMRSKGYIGQYNGAKVVVLPQSFFEPTNEGGENLVVPPGMAWIFPAGNEKPVKIVFEGQTIVEEFANRDYSKELQFMKKMGVALLTNPGMAVYTNTALNNWPNVESPAGYMNPSYMYVVN